MAEDTGLTGVRSGDQEEPVHEEGEVPDKILERLEGIRNLEDLEELLGEEGIEGITKPEGLVQLVDQEGVSVSPRTIAIIEAAVRQQVNELQDVNSTLQLLRILAGILNGQAQQNEDIIELLERLLKTQRFDQILDAREIEFSKANSSRDLIDQDNAETDLIKVNADSKNDGPLWIGEEGLSPGEGLKLPKGDEEEVPVDVSLTEVEIVAENEGDKYSYIAYGTSIPSVIGGP